MRICIEARMMGAENTRGLGRYIQELVGALLRVAPTNQYVLVTRSSDHPFAHRANVQTVIADIPWYGWREQITMPRILRSVRADVVHIPHWNVPLAYAGPLVVTIHDLLLLHQPASANASTRAWPVRTIKRLGFKLTLRHTIKSARKICVPTDFVRRDVERFFPSAVGKVEVTGEGIPTFAPSAQATDFMTHGMPYLLYVGSAYPHKRLDLLLEAWKVVSATHPGLVLVVAGEMDAFMTRIKHQADARGLPRIIFTGRVAEDALAGLLGKATAFVWPSSFEGFGLPPLEALAQGCPVVSSDAEPMPVVLGKNGVVYFKSGSADGMIQAINKVVDNSDAFRTQSLAGRAQLLERHSWDRAAIKTLDAYRRAWGGTDS